MSDPNQTSSNATPTTSVDAAPVIDTQAAPAASTSNDQPVADVVAPAATPVVASAEPIGPVRSATPVSTAQLQSATQKLQHVSEGVTIAAANGTLPDAIATQATEVVTEAAAAVQQLVQEEVKDVGEQVKGEVIDEIDKAVNQVAESSNTLMDRLRLMLTEANDTIHDGWDEAVEIANTMTKDEKEMPEKVALVFGTVGHEVSDNYRRFAAFLKKYL